MTQYPQKIDSECLSTGLAQEKKRCDRSRPMQRNWRSAKKKSRNKLRRIMKMITVNSD